MSSAHAIAEALKGNKALKRKKIGASYLVPCPAHKDDRPSLSIGDGDKGLLVYCHAGCTARDVFAALRARGLLDQNWKEAKPTYSVRTICENHRDDAARTAKAAWLWSQRRSLTGSPVEKYLRRRGYTGEIPATIRHLPPRGEHSAAMICAFGIAPEIEPGLIAPPKIVPGIHLTKLTDDGDKIANGDGNAKIMVGTCKGWPIIISPSNDLLGMAITEGVEDALNAFQATGLGVWAAGSAGFMPALAALIPDYIECVTIFAHSDPAGRSNAIELARKLKLRIPEPEVLIEGL
jgi:hypothetical protein